MSSFRRAVAAFNAPDDDGRTTSVLLHLQHATEMILKAHLVEAGIRVFDKRLGRSIGFEKCVNLASAELGLSSEDAGLLRAVDALRDEEQHWYVVVSEGLLYVHCRATTTVVDNLLWKLAKERISDYLPHRVLPLSSEPPRDIQILIQEEYDTIQLLLRPGRRQRSEARARIRTLLALEAHMKVDVRVSSLDVNRVERAAKDGHTRAAAFPQLERLTSDIDGEGFAMTFRFSKKEGLPVKYVSDGEDAVGIREVDLQKKFHWSPTALAKKLNLTTGKAKALRWSLGIDDDPDCRRIFRFGGSEHEGYSDNAYLKMLEALKTCDIDEVWRSRQRHLKATK